MLVHVERRALAPADARAAAGDGAGGGGAGGARGGGGGDADGGVVLRSQLCMVDLAGSERAKKSARSCGSLRSSRRST